LAEDDERVDLRVLLAEALWWAGEKIEAEEVCRLLLEQLPNCVQANAILAEILMQTGREEDAQPYLPFGGVGAARFGES
jgi:predicted Zn-dependent protease